jgi:hypothetical protein
VNVRLARPDDNEQLIHLARVAPMQGAMRIATDRSPDYFAYPALLGDDLEIWVWDDDGEILGCGLFYGRTERVGGETVRVLHMGDGRLAHRARSRGRVFRDFGLDFIHQRFEQGGYDAAHGEIIGDNKASLALIMVIGQRYRLRDVGPVHNYQLLPIKHLRVSGDHRLRRGEKDDLPALAEILDETYRGHTAAPVFDVEGLSASFSQHPSFGIGDMWVAERRGRVVACVGTWDQHSIRRYVVENLTPAPWLVATGLRLLGPLFSLPPAPHVGEPLRQSFMRFSGHLPGHEAALRDVVRRGRVQTFVIAGLHDADPQLACLEGIPKLSLSTRVFRWAEERNESAIGPEGNPVYFDPALS